MTRWTAADASAASEAVSSLQQALAEDDDPTALRVTAADVHCPAGYWPRLRVAITRCARSFTRAVWANGTFLEGADRRRPAPDGKKVPIPISVQDLRHVLKFLQRELGEDLPPAAAASVYTALFREGAPARHWRLRAVVGAFVPSASLGLFGDPVKGRFAPNGES